jgi:microsomal dipeptidase-like Zn-dependent dipeptidase
VSFGSVLYVPSDELFGPCAAFENLEKQLATADAKLRSEGFVVARNGKAFAESVQSGAPTAFHCLEGGFSIERSEQVERLAQLGIAYVVLAHLLFRDIAACVNAFPFLTDEEFERMFPMPVEGLTPRGTMLCEALCRHGVIPDITHMTATAAGQVFDIAAANRPPRPVIVSHGAPQRGRAAEHKLNLSEDIICRIARSRGVIGVIFFDHWLLPVGRDLDTEGTIDDVVSAVRRIAEVAGGTECIAIGSDLDGFIQPVKGLEHIGQIRKLEKALRAEFPPSQTEGILWRNAARVLENGWGSA